MIEIDESVKVEKKYGETEKSHPSFGRIRLSRIACGNRALFGSHILHDNMISLEISHAHTYRKFHEDNYSSVGEDDIVKIYLSPLQFSEMLTTMNYSDGVPCTIARKGRQGIKYPTEATVDKVEEFLEESGDVVGDLRDRLRPHLKEVAENLNSGKALGKGAQQELLRTLKSLDEFLGSNSKFLLDMFGEFIDKQVTEAKATIDSHVDTVVRQTGIKALKDTKQLN